MIKVWGKTKINNKIIKDCIVKFDEDFSEESILESVYKICIKFDIPRPIILDKHKKDMHEFLLMQFLPDDFIEEVDFDKFEIEIFEVTVE